MVITTERNVRKQPAQALRVGMSCSPGGDNDVAPSLEQCPLTRESSDKGGMVARQHRQRWNQVLRTLSDPFQMIVEPGRLTPYQELEWLELRVQKLRSAGEDRFLRGVVGATERRVSPSHVEHRDAVRARSGPESSYAVVDGLQLDASLNGRGAHESLRRRVKASATVGATQSSSGDELAQSDASGAVTRDIFSAGRHAYRRGAKAYCRPANAQRSSGRPPGWMSEQAALATISKQPRTARTSGASMLAWSHIR